MTRIVQLHQHDVCTISLQCPITPSTELQARRMQCPLSAQIGLMAITVENFLIGLIK